ncbi:DUF177 domain-containing protein [Pedobacter sp. MC2016-05]|uniref:YceD family protein n=1 Tax=unclassified Pedobacter TaxID=2628915 RepID=UPI0007026AF5|nr:MULTISPECIES: DUF177 domain-containing protein [unclassified Pedobacter]KQN33960.1 hypothetical protein ASE92_15060 [Pedobacter sp. Leaf41]MCX2475242.1 DUF177 domain-containing protein [Pedobacter sp. MC2016-05]RZL29755.1 MAG: DUF177 domain-containing protein [Pedobacter sp.]
MKPLKQFSIPFTGLKLGVHHFDYELDDRFFNAFEYSLIKSGDLKVELELEKQETMLLLKFKVIGTVNLDCDKCLSEFAYPVNLYERQIVKFAEDELESDDEEIITLNRKDTEIDISAPLYEMINVAVPYIKNCEQADKECDQEMIDRLEQLSIDKQAEENEQTSDPRWEALNKLKK